MSNEAEKVPTEEPPHVLTLDGHCRQERDTDILSSAARPGTALPGRAGWRSDYSDAQSWDGKTAPVRSLCALGDAVRTGGEAAVGRMRGPAALGGASFLGASASEPGSQASRWQIRLSSLLSGPRPGSWSFWNSSPLPVNALASRIVVTTNTQCAVSHTKAQHSSLGGTRTRSVQGSQSRGCLGNSGW